MIYRFLISALLIFINQTIHATVYQVGPTRPYTVPSAVANLVNAGDTVEIDAGTYTGDVAIWYDNDLLIRGVGAGYARLDANGNNAQGKAIWVIKGDNNRIENIEFLNCTVPDHNGAGIRQEGKNVHIKHCFFHHNEMGILAGDNTGSSFLIEYCEFSFNGYGDGYTHNVYINHIDTLTFRYNYSHDPTVGHALKTRARYNYILYNRITEENGDGSYTIDIPNGGETIVMGNLIEQGPNSQNSTIIEYGAEGISNPIADFIVVNNTIVNNRPSGTFFFVNAATQLFRLYNNLVLGNGTYINGTPVTLDSLGNLRLTSIANAQLMGPASFNYQLLATSPAINAGVYAGTYHNISLTPTFRYIHPQEAGARILIDNVVDIGAYEYIGENCTFVPNVSGLTTVCNDNTAIYSVPELLGSTYVWTVTGGTILGGQGTNMISVLWGSGGTGVVNVVQVVP
jgi:hypothetical protein